ncbi:MAG: TRAP transporter permease, partial [Ostreibacterium sp.]
MNNKNQQMTEGELQALVDSTDTGGRNPHGFPAKLIFGVALAWSLFQLYFSSPLPFILQAWLNGHGINITVALDDTKARSIHLAFAILLAFLSYPAFKNSPQNRIPLPDWILAIGGACLGAYYFIFYHHISTLIGQPTVLDLSSGVLGILVLLEATRRTLGLPLAIIAISFLVFNIAGPYLPQLIAHNANSLAIIIKQQWLTTEGIFGIALGVSTKFVFLFVLFGALLDKAGAGNYFIQTAFSLLGHFRGGPAKAAVIASGLTGLISGSSIANVVTTGTFTIPMMRKVGFSSEKAGAVEVASSVNGQIMPPVMGAAAFLMVEYVGISYFEV